MPYSLLSKAFIPAAGASPGRTVWMQPPDAGTPRFTLLFLDAEIYIEAVYAPSILKGLEQQHRIPPVSAFYISHGGAPARHVDYTCSVDYSAFVAHQVLGWVRANGCEPARVVIVGLSLSGLAAAHVAVQFPRLFHSVICQSPSMWWANERFRESVPPPPAECLKLWISVGDQEINKEVSHQPSGLYQPTSQIDSCRRACEALIERGYCVKEHVFQGGHDPKCWREDLPAALEWVTQ